MATIIASKNSNEIAPQKLIAQIYNYDNDTPPTREYFIKKLTQSINLLNKETPILKNNKPLMNLINNFLTIHKIILSIAARIKYLEALKNIYPNKNDSEELLKRTGIKDINTEIKDAKKDLNFAKGNENIMLINLSEKYYPEWLSNINQVDRKKHHMYLDELQNYLNILKISIETDLP